MKQSFDVAVDPESTRSITGA